MIAPPFTEREFQPSSRFSKRFDQYPLWAASAANLAFQLWKEGAEPRGILESLAESRRRFAYETKEPFPDHFGQPREGDSISHLHLGHSETIRRASRDLSRFISTPLRFEEGPPSVPRLSRETFYIGLDDKRYATTRVGRYLQPVKIPPRQFEAGSLVLEHSPISHVLPILTDIFSRLALLRNPAASNSQHLVLAMYGYYQAMPYRRGSAAIGRSFFAALDLAVCGKSLSPKTDPDLFAMTALSQVEYCKEMLLLHRLH